MSVRGSQAKYGYDPPWMSEGQGLGTSTLWEDLMTQPHSSACSNLP